MADDEDAANTGLELGDQAMNVSKQSRNRLCFVVGPIGSLGTDTRKHSDLLLNAVIRTVLEGAEFKYTVRRGDESAQPGMIVAQVIRDIIHADLVVADLTDLNANAFYELGVCHLLGKPTIHVARVETVVPFNNGGHRTIFVDLADWHSTEKARQELAASVRETRLPEYQVTNPVAQATGGIPGLQRLLARWSNGISRAA